MMLFIKLYFLKFFVFFNFFLSDLNLHFTTTLKKYHDFLNVFFKQKIDKLSFHKKYNHFNELMKKNVNQNFIILNVKTKIKIDRN